MDYLGVRMTRFITPASSGPITSHYVMLLYEGLCSTFSFVLHPHFTVLAVVFFLELRSPHSATHFPQ